MVTESAGSTGVTWPNVAVLDRFACLVTLTLGSHSGNELCSSCDPGEGVGAEEEKVDSEEAQSVSCQSPGHCCQ